MKCALSTCSQTLSNVRCISNHDCLGSIRHVAVLLDGHVELEQIAIAKLSHAWDAVHDLFIDADATHAGKSVHKSRSRARSMLAHNLRTDMIQLAGGDARARGL